jgi:hypothetical protein
LDCFRVSRFRKCEGQSSVSRALTPAATAANAQGSIVAGGFDLSTMARLLVSVSAALLWFFVPAFGQDAARRIVVPNPQLVPGDTNPDITPDNIGENICKKGWSTKSIRPKTSYTTFLKMAQLLSLKYTLPNRLPAVATKSGNGTRPDISRCIERSSNLACYEEDHLIPLELGGNPSSPANLWPEPRFGVWNAGVKDLLERKLHKMVCDGQISLRDAQNAIATDWIVAYKQYFESP